MLDFTNHEHASAPFTKTKRVQFCAILVLGVVTSVLLVYHLIGSLPAMSLSASQARFWDTIFKGVGGLVAVGGGLFSLRKYLNERKTQNKTALLEARKPFMAKRQQVFDELTTLTATISNKGLGDGLRTEAEQRFWVLFWGAVPMVADYEVGAAVNHFSECMDFPEQDIALRNASMALALACRRALGFAGPDSQILVDFPSEAAERASRQG